MVTSIELNSAFHPFGLSKSSIGLSGWAYRLARSLVSDGLQITLVCFLMAVDAP